MYHSITFGTKNTWDDWHLIPTSRPVFNPPPVKTKYIDIPGANGQLDLSTLLTGAPTYGMRSGSFEFMVENDFLPWDTAYSNICNHLHGQYMIAYLEDDPDHYYEGRFSVDQWRSNPNFSTVLVNYTVNPFKKVRFGTAVEWEWDPFDFETGVIQKFVNLAVDGTDSLTVTVIGSVRAVIPTFTASAALTFALRGITYELPEGTSRTSAIQILPGDNVLVFSGTGTITIDYRGEGL